MFTRDNAGNSINWPTGFNLVEVRALTGATGALKEREMTASPAPVVNESPFRAGLVAVRRFWRPFVLMQVAAVLLVVAYRASAQVRDVCAALVGLRQEGGLAFSAVASAIAGVLLPEAATLATVPAERGRPGRPGKLAFTTAFFLLNGTVVDLFYRLSAHLFGRAATPAVVAQKVAFDQFVFTPLWVSAIAALFVWNKHGFRLAPTRADLSDGFLQRRLLPLLLPNWCFWIPMCAVIYALPVPLQFLLFVFALAAWSLIMVFIAAR